MSNRAIKADAPVKIGRVVKMQSKGKVMEVTPAFLNGRRL